MFLLTKLKKYNKKKNSMSQGEDKPQPLNKSSSEMQNVYSKNNFWLKKNKKGYLFGICPIVERL